MAEANKVIRITVETDKAKIKIEGIEQYFRKAETAGKALNNLLEKNTQKWGRTEAALRENIAAYKSLRSQTAGTTAEYKKQSIHIDKLEAELNGLTSAQNKASKSMGSMENSAGIAGATVNELGRTISDMPYGITAITNNISQLGSMFAILVTKVGGVQKAFQSLFATLKASPALVALLAFQALVAIIDVFAQRARKADKAAKGLSQSVGEAATELKIARKILNDSNTSLERKESILSQVNKEYKDLNLSLDETGKATKESTAALDEHIASLERLAKSQAIVIQVQKIYGEMALLQTKSGKEVSDSVDYVNAQAQNLLNTVNMILTAGVFYRDGDFYEKKIEELGQKTKEIALKAQQETADALIKQLTNLFPEKDSGKGAVKKLSDLNLLIIRAEIAFMESLSRTTEEGQLKKQKRIEELRLLELELLKKAAIEKAKEEGRNGAELLAIEGIYQKKRLTLINDSNAKLMAIRKSFNNELKLDMEDYADDKHLEAMLETLLPTEEQVQNRAKKITDSLAAYQKRREDAERNGNEAVHKLRVDNLNKAADALNVLADLAESAFGIMDAEFQKQMDLEQNKTTALNNQLRERLANEQLSANERKNIQAQISANDEALRVRQEAIAKKRFKVEKALRISVAVIDTASSALKAYASQLIVGDPTSIIRAQVAAGLATALGLAQVAMISKQQFVSSASSSPAGLGGASGAGGGGIQAPDFNIVGQSSSNQLAAAVQGQFQQPIKAYVVSKDVSTAQEMDRNIVGSASLG